MKQILFADNDPGFLNARTEFLEGAGYHVLKAYTLDETRELLDRSCVHLAILDIRMVNDNDERDMSGLILAKTPDYHSVPKIILTGFPTYQAVREALGSILDGLPLAVGFVAKQEGPEKLLEAVEEAFTQHVRINSNLHIRWGEGPLFSFSSLVGMIEATFSSDHPSDRASEIEDLFRKLFYSYDQITFSQLIWRKKDRVALEVFAYSKEWREEQFVVICSHIRSGGLEQEPDAKPASRPLASEVVTPTLIAETRHFAATTFAIHDAGKEKIQCLAEFYREKPDKQIRGALQHLFQTTLSPWYQQGRTVEETKSLSELYREQLGLTLGTIPPEELERKLRSLSKEAVSRDIAAITSSSEQLVVRFAGGRAVSHRNPARSLYDAGALLTPRVVLTMMPTGLDFDTIIVDQVGQTRLTDLYQADHVPIWHSFVSLEAAIRVRLLDVGNLVTRYDFERRLLTVNHLNDQISPGSVEPEHRKALGAIQTIRELASIVVEDDLRAYYIALLFCTMGYLVDYDPVFRHTESEIVKLLHGLLLSALLCEKIDQLEKTGSENPATHISGGLQVDLDNREATVGGKQITLTEREFDLLAYLYRNAGKLCKRSDIARDVLGSTSSDEAESWINTNMGRLRKKIGKKYIITVRGQGHKLVLEPE